MLFEQNVLFNILAIGRSYLHLLYIGFMVLCNVTVFFLVSRRSSTHTEHKFVIIDHLCTGIEQLSVIFSKTVKITGRISQPVWNQLLI